MGAELIFPGFIDIQVNGCCGVDFNDPDRLNLESIQEACRYQWNTGVVRFCPAVVSNSDEVIREILVKIVEAQRRDELVKMTMPGVHLEIYVSPKAGGCHNSAYFRNPDWKFVEDLGELAGAINIITVAPELDGAMEFIKRAVLANKVVGIGHTMADHETIRRAWEAGAYFSTHLGNGIPKMLSRNENPIISQLNMSGLRASFIADFHHISSETLNFYVRRCKGIGASVITTDSIFAAGLGDGNFVFAGQNIQVENGRACLSCDSDVLAGSVVSMPEMVGNLNSAGFNWYEIVYLSSANPANLLNLSSSIVSRSEVEAKVVGGKLRVERVIVDYKRVV